ncbi:MAG: leucine-rich repeat domain-containing protein [Clostridia bacterium]|nr:leucine-rich repeat domain-containing protein [Clostridia bacterium]
MKKVLVILLLTSMLFCSFTIGAGAVELYANNSGTSYAEYGDPIRITDENGNDIAFDNGIFGTDGHFSTATAMVLITYNGQEYTFPSYYVIDNNSTLTWNFSIVEEYLQEQTGSSDTVSVSNVKQMDIPYGITEIPRRAFVDDAHWLEQGTEEKPYAHATESSTLTYVSFPITLLKVDDFAFAHCIELANIVMPDDVRIQHIGYRTFHGCKFTSFTFNEHLVHLGEGCFEHCDFTSINLSKCTELKVIPANAFHESEASKVEIILSNSIETIGANAFTGLHASVLYLGTSLKYVGEYAFDADKLDLLLVPVTLENLEVTSFATGAANTKIAIVGPYDEETAKSLASVLNKCEDAKKLASATGAGLISYTEDYFSGNSSFCEEYCGGHTFDHNSTVTGTVTFPNGFDKEGYIAGARCGVCLAETIETQTLLPIIFSKGYSLCTYNNMIAYTNGFEINHGSLSVYEQANGALELGLVFLGASAYSAGDDLYTIASVIIPVDKSMYATFDFVVTYSTGAQKAGVPVIIAGYVKDSNGNISYIQDQDDICLAGKTSDGLYNTVSYNSIYGDIYVENVASESLKKEEEIAE